jgi:transcriptional regulator with XRE-family HTH domain
MQERLQELLNKERLTPVRFSELVGVQRSSVSHILSGRNKPSLDFLQKILTAFEHINPDWLISGKGAYKRNNFNDKLDSSEKPFGKKKEENSRINFPNSRPVKDEDPVQYGKQQVSSIKEDPQFKSAETGASNQTDMPFDAEKLDPPSDTKKRKQVIKTVFFYDDQTFEIFYPGDIS